MSSPAPPATNSRTMKVALTCLGILTLLITWVADFDFFAQAGIPVGLALILAAWSKSTEARKILVQDVGGAVLLFALVLGVSGGNLLTGPYAAADAAKTGDLGGFLENLGLLLSLFAWLGVCRSALFEVFKRWIEPGSESS